MKILRAILAYASVALVLGSAYAGESTGLRHPFALHVGEKREVKPPGIEVTLRSLAADSGCLAADDCSAMLFRGTLVLRYGARTELHEFDAMIAPDAPLMIEFAGFELELGSVRPDPGGKLAVTFTLLEPNYEDDTVAGAASSDPDHQGAQTVDRGDAHATLVAPPAPERGSAQTAHATHIALRAADRSDGEAVPIWIEPEQASLSNSGWMLFFHTALPLSKFEVRQQGRADWQNVPVALGGGREFYTGFGFFDEQVVIEARAVTPDGRSLGPYALPFDALASLREQDMRTMRDVPDVWVQYDDPNVYFTLFYECNCAIREVHYSINDKSLDKTLALPPCSMKRHGEIPSDNSEILRLKEKPEFVAVRVVFYDGTVSPVKIVHEGMH